MSTYRLPSAVSVAVAVALAVAILGAGLAGAEVIIRPPNAKFKLSTHGTYIEFSDNATADRITVNAENVVFESIKLEDSPYTTSSLTVGVENADITIKALEDENIEFDLTAPIGTKSLSGMTDEDREKPKKVKLNGVEIPEKGSLPELHASDNGWFHDGNTVYVKVTHGSTEEVFIDYILDLNVAPNPPTSLLCEGQTNPTQITDFTPEFSAIYTDNDVGDNAENTEIWVGTTSGDNDVWASSWIDIATCENGGRCQDVSYAGPGLVGGRTYYWKCRFMDAGGLEGAWSDPAWFKMGYSPAIWVWLGIGAYEDEEEPAEPGADIQPGTYVGGEWVPRERFSPGETLFLRALVSDAETSDPITFARVPMTLAYDGRGLEVRQPESGLYEGSLLLVDIPADGHTIEVEVHAEGYTDWSGEATFHVEEAPVLPPAVVPWWQQWWAWLGIGVAALVAVALVWRGRKELVK